MLDVSGNFMTSKRLKHIAIPILGGSYFLITLLVSCGHQPTQKEKNAQIISLSKEAIPFMDSAMKNQFTDSAKSFHYYRLALNKFLEAVSIDTNFKKSAIYLPDLYNKLHMTDSANYWKNWLGSEYN